MNQFDKFRKIYVDNIMRREYPLLPAYFYYLEHTDNKYILSSYEFERMFMKSINSFTHPISLETYGPILDLDQVYNILDSYYDIGYLYNQKEELIKVV